MKNIRILIIILFVLVNISKSNAQLQGQARLDSLLKELPKSKEDTNKVKLLSDISYNYNSIEPKKGILYGNQSEELSNKLNWKLGLAASYNSIGTNYHALSNYSKAIEYFKKSLEINSSLKDSNGIAVCYNNIGQLYSFTSNYPEALNYFTLALNINEHLNNKLGMALNYTNIGSVNYFQYNYRKAIEYNKKALAINEEIKNYIGMANNYGGLGVFYMQLSDYSNAKIFISKAIDLNRKLNNLNGLAVNLGALGNLESDMGNYDGSLKLHNQALEINRKVNNLSGIANNLGNMGDVYLILSQDSILNKKYESREKRSITKEVNLNKSINSSIEAVKILKDIGERHNLFYALKNLSVAYKLKGDYKDAYDALEESKSIQDSVFNIEKSNEISKLENARENLVKDRKIAILNEREKSSARERNIIIISASIGLILILLVLLVIINQRRKSEALLLNILPAKIAKRLKSKEVSIADDIENATTIFIDLVGFTSFAKDKKASEVLKILNNIFSRIDKLVSEYGLEKIKTIGDGYMAAAGVPEPISDHAEKAVEFTLAVRNEIEKFNTETGMNISARMGLESGPLVAGVIGDSKFIYDLWGDSVNTASRMESTGFPNQIQITENVKQELESVKTSYQFTPREPIEVKGRGIMHTYFIERAEIISTK